MLNWTASTQSYFHSPFSGYKETIAAVLSENNFQEDALFGALRTHPRLHFLLNQPSRVVQNYSIEEHSHMVVKQFEKYFRNDSLPLNFSTNDFRLLLALHDIGKSIPENPADQHRHTVETIRRLQDQIPFTDQGWRIGEVLLKNDYIGSLLKSCARTSVPKSKRDEVLERFRRGEQSIEAIEECKSFITYKYCSKSEVPPDVRQMIFSISQRIRSDAQELDVDPKELFALMEILYQCDTSSYTCDSVSPLTKNRLPGLEFLYLYSSSIESDSFLHFDPVAKRLKYVPEIDRAISLLSEEFQ